MPTEVSGSSPQGGTAVQPGAQSAVFADGINATIKTTTATYPDAPTDFGVPPTDRFWMALYGTGEYVLWQYDVSATAWVRWVEGVAVP